MPRRVLSGIVALVMLGALGACGDDEPDAATTTSTVVDDESADRGEADDEPDTTETTESDGAVEPPPDHAGDEDDGLGDPLVYIADLTGDTAVPGPGDGEGTGRIEIVATTEQEWCIDMEATGLSSDVRDAHLHFGTEGMSGDVVIPIGEPTSTAGDTDTWTDVCVTVEEQLAAEIVDAPQAFYANIHTADHPDGAIRGQLEPSSLFDLTLS